MLWKATARKISFIPAKSIQLLFFKQCLVSLFVPGVSVPLQLGLPDAIPPQYGALKEVSIHTVRARLRLLYHFSDLMYSSWRLLNLSPNNQVKFHLKKLAWLCCLAREFLTRSRWTLVIGSVVFWFWEKKKKGENK